MTPAAPIPVAQFPEEWYLTAPRSLAGMAQVHGPIFSRVMDDGPMAGQEFLYLAGPEANRFVLHTHRDLFSHDLGWTPVVGEWAGKGLLNMDPPEHTRHRRLWNPAFTSAYMAQYLPVVERVILEHIAGWAARGEVDLFAEAREITFGVAALALAGFDGTAIERLRGLFYALLHGYDEGEETWEQFVTRRQRVVEELHGIMLPLIEQRRRQPPETQPRDVLSQIVHARDGDGLALTDAQVLDHVKILLVAGHETTTTLGAWLLYLLATHPQSLAQVRAELDATLPGTDGPASANGRVSHVPFEALRGLRTLDNAVAETGRLHPPVVTVPRGVLREAEFAGHIIPAGAQARLALAASHYLPDLFAHPEQFQPDRFEPPREEDRRHPFALVTFGGGPRLCIGMHFANLEVKLLAAHVLRSYDLAPVPDQQIVEVGFITTFLPNGIRVSVQPRP